MKNAIALGLLCITLTGCWSNSNSRSVNLVKNSSYTNMQQGGTIGEVLSNRGICKNVTWTDAINDFGDPTVEYRCELTDYKTFYTNVNKQHLNDKLAKVEETRDAAIRLMYVGEETLRELEYRNIQFNVFEKAVYSVRNQGLIKEYKKVAKQLGLDSNRIDYRFLFNKNKEYRVSNWNNANQIRFKQLEAKIKNELLIYGIDESYYNILGLNLSFEYGKDVLDLTEAETVGYFARAHSDIYKRSEYVANEVNYHKNALRQLKYANEIVENYIPRKVVQVVKFNLITGQAIADQCNFEIDSVPTNEDNSSIHLDYCLKMAYDKEYNESFKQLFVEDFENKLAHKPY